MIASSNQIRLMKMNRLTKGQGLEIKSKAGHSCMGQALAECATAGLKLNTHMATCKKEGRSGGDRMVVAECPRNAISKFTNHTINQLALPIFSSASA